jgi:hypothetical protein
MLHLYKAIIFGLSEVHPDGLPTPAADPGTIQNILQIVFGIVGALAFLMIVISGLRYVVSAGNPDRTKRAKDGIVYALVGIVIAISAEVIVTFVVGNI